MKKSENVNKQKKQRKISKVLLWVLVVMLIVGGAVSLTYTTVLCCINQINHSYVIDDYDNKVDNMTDKQISDIESKAQEYNEALDSLEKGTYDKNTVQGNYDVLELGDIISYISIPKINVYLPIYQNTSEEVLQKGIAHEKNSSLPVGGENTNCVLLGHSGLTTDDLFTNLNKLKEGDEFSLFTLNKEYKYRVCEVYTVLPEKVNSFLQIKEHRDIVTLITCTPVGINTHRLIVIGDRVKTADRVNKEKIKQDKNENKNSYDNLKTHYNYIFIATAIIIFLFVTGFVVVRIIKKEKNGKEKG